MVEHPGGGCSGRGRPPPLPHAPALLSLHTLPHRFPFTSAQAAFFPFTSDQYPLPLLHSFIYFINLKHFFLIFIFHLSSFIFHLFLHLLIIHLQLWRCVSRDGPVELPPGGQDIQVCQQKGKRVFLSVGGASGAYGLANDGQAQGLAGQVWNFFLGGSSPTRPFGYAKLDGIDLDIEAGDPSHFGAFVRSLKANFTTDPSKRYYISYELRTSFFVLRSSCSSLSFFSDHRHSPGLPRSVRSLMPTTDPTTPAAHLTPDWWTTSGSRYRFL
jgi:hypothetical protein